MTRDLLSNDRRVCPGGHLSVYKELQRFLCYLSLSASAHGKKVAAAFAAVLH
ncbi:MAG TPA: hypothetical protein K8V76_11495 [Bacteroides ovatus]|nr:hypothetical protein [Bacteroides ovatus]